MKTNKGLAPIAIVLIIIAVLAVGGAAYYTGKKANHSQNFTKQSECVSYKNSQAGYELCYPSNWLMMPESQLGESFLIKNNPDAVLRGANSEPRENDSYVEITVTNNMDYSNYEEFIKDSKFGLSPNTIAERITNLEMVDIGGKILQAFTGIKLPDNSNSKLYSFIYNRKLYSIDFVSGSKTQYNKDSEAFSDLVSSFQFI